MSSENPFASPQASSRTSLPPGANVGFGGIWRSGDCLVVAHQAQLPDRCVKCNASTPGLKKPFKLSWHNPIVFAGLLLGAIPYILMALVLRKQMTVQAGVCEEHMARRRNAVLLGVLLLFAGLAIIFLGGSRDNGWIMLVGLLMILASLIYLVVVPRILWPKKITKQFAWVKGVSPEYLAALPEFPGV